MLQQIQSDSDFERMVEDVMADSDLYGACSRERAEEIVERTIENWGMGPDKPGEDS